MRRLILLSSLFVLCLTSAVQGQAPIKYGSNPAAGSTFTHDGIQLYYEVYGAGEPLLLVHGGGLSIASSKAQIEYFRQHYKVIAMDSRDQGRSGDSPDKITYEKTDDLAALLDHLNVSRCTFSDGAMAASKHFCLGSGIQRR
jgi:pimeloyl-ACP methyl ester carboxylesterase